MTTVQAPDVAAPAGAAAPRRTERVAALVQRHGALAVLALVALIASLSFDTFATADNVRNIAITSSFLAIVALGMTFVIISGGIDLSVGSLFALGGVLAAWGSRYGSAAAIALPLGVCGLIGAMNGLLIAKARMPAFIVTLASLLGARGLLLAITSEGANTYLVPRGSAFAELGQGKVAGIGYPVLIAAALFALGGLVLARTRFGQRIYAVGGSEDAASLMGVPVARVRVTVYLLSGLLAGLAGALNAARLSSGVTIVGVGMELDAIAAVVIGGTLLVGGAGTVSGTLSGVLLLGAILNVINQIGTLDSAYQSVVNGAFLVAVVVVQTYLSRTQRVRWRQ
jgi:ribose/xylose/arabinose/galactoside ABC-type transport system permease subunit